MKAEQQKTLSRILENGKTILLALLTVSLIVLVVVYIASTKIYESMTDQGRATPLDKLRIVQSDQSMPEGLESDHLLPELIGYRAAGTNSGSLGYGEAAAALYESVKPCLKELLGQASVCRALSDSQAASAVNEALSAENLVYIRYHEPILFHLIWAWASEQITVEIDDTASSEDGAYIKELIILPDRDFVLAAHRFIAYAHDGSGRWYEFRPDESVLTSSFYISKMAADGSAMDVIPFTFSSASETDGLWDLQPITEDTPTCETLLMDYRPILPTDESQDSGLTDSLLRLLGYNPNKLNAYPDTADQAVVFIDTHGQLRLSNQRIYYQASDDENGLRIDSLLGYSTGGTYSLFDRVSAVDSLIRRMSAIDIGLTGKEARLCLGQIYTEDSLLVIEYFYTFNNIRIGSSSSPAALRAKLSQDSILSLEFAPRSYTGSGNTVLLTEPLYILRQLLRTDPGMIPDTFRLRYMDGSDGTLDAEWCFLSANAREGGLS